ncbi:MAG: hypothetical protein ACJ74H_05910 [Thermoanaerobaculia bacterium]
MKTWQSYVRNAAIHALDEGTSRLAESGETVIHRLAKEWRGLSESEKQELIEIAVAIGGAISVAAAAFRESGSKKKKAKKAAKKAGKTVLKKVAAKVKKK